MIDCPPPLKPREACASCGAAVATPHDEGCDSAVCLVTGAQRLLCNALSPLHECPEQFFTGYWHGEFECYEHGWFTTVEGKIFPDLNRVHDEMRWDSSQQKLVMRNPISPRMERIKRPWPPTHPDWTSDDLEAQEFYQALRDALYEAKRDLDRMMKISIGSTDAAIGYFIQRFIYHQLVQAERPRVPEEKWGDMDDTRREQYRKVVGAVDAAQADLEGKIKLGMTDADAAIGYIIQRLYYHYRVNTPYVRK